MISILSARVELVSHLNDYYVCRCRRYLDFTKLYTHNICNT